MARTATVAKTEEPNIVQEAVDASGGDESQAVEILYSRVVSDADFLKSELPTLVRRWCQSQIGTLLGAQRVKAWKPQPVTHNPNRLNAAIRANLLDYPLPRGKRLGDASTDDLAQASGYYWGVSNSNAHKARWLDAIAARMGNAHRVEDALTEADLQALQIEAE